MAIQPIELEIKSYQPLAKLELTSLGTLDNGTNPILGGYLKVIA